MGSDVSCVAAITDTNTKHHHHLIRSTSSFGWGAFCLNFEAKKLWKVYYESIIRAFCFEKMKFVIAKKRDSSSSRLAGPNNETLSEFRVSWSVKSCVNWPR